MDNLIQTRIKSRRKELKMTQSDLAKKAGLQPPAISQYESGVRSPSFEALRKLSVALDVSTDYLMNGISSTSSDQHFDYFEKILLKLIQSIPTSKKENLLEFATFLATERNINTKMEYDDPSDYANSLLNKYGCDLPIDLESLTKELKIKVIEQELDEGEGILIQGNHPIILLDNRKNIYPSRKKFTLATLLGHFVIPWHIKSSYISRKYNEADKQNDNRIGHSTLLTEEIEDMEAQNFAANLLMPFNEISNDFIKVDTSLENLKSLAEQKYHISLFTLLNHLVKLSNGKYAVLQSENYRIIKTFQGKYSLKSEFVDQQSKASSFFSNPSTKEEIREGIVPQSSWLNDIDKDLTVYEQSIYNPDFGKVLTLLTINENK
ncbi:helix-turn-helix domain-containing protein [Calidifontibacillus oryziterrae]|uniref:helix-turn-helix domain-containing protein n=1 Tax=Calidifontibacillus oryziterrae TaxID=1191699 RepID=UPI0002F292C2|nr:helix-turn-helix domain-containing protein [Calidifontibacillus oryziterrae]